MQSPAEGTRGGDGGGLASEALLTAARLVRVGGADRAVAVEVGALPGDKGCAGAGAGARMRAGMRAGAGAREGQAFGRGASDI